MTRGATLLTLLVSLLLSGSAQDRPTVEGRWQGSVNLGVAELPVLLTIEKSGKGLVARLDRLDEAGGSIPAENIRSDGDALHLEFKKLHAAYDGRIDQNGSRLTGTWLGKPNSPLTFVRAQAAAQGEAAIRLRVPTPPGVIQGGGQRHLVYELSIRNTGGSAVVLKQIDVVGPAAPLASYSNRDLAALLAGTKINSGTGVLAYLWITLGSDATIPASIKHKVTFESGDPIEGAEIAVASAAPPILGPPLRGEGWRAANGPANSSPHRRAAIPIEGQSYLAQRFAIDWIRLNAHGNMQSGNRKVNENYFGHGSDVLAVADAVVVKIKDGIPENVPGETSRAVPITMETVGGNFIILDIGGGSYAFYAHLKPGSLKVKAGDRVRRGQVLALLGNSGNSTAPHLHFHVADRAEPLQSNGLPYVLDAFEVRAKGQQFEKRQNQIPLLDELVRFP